MLRNTLNTFITATLIMLLGVSSSASAQTIVPMGDLMGSTSVIWGDQGETTKSSALRVDLVPAEPRIKQVETDPPGNEQLPGEPVTVTYTITSEANGPDDYALAADYDDGAAAEANLVDSPTTEILGPDGQPASVNLGATAATGPTDEGSRTITVICDAASSSEISCNGIDALDTVIIGDGDTAYTVATGGVSNTGDGPSTIRLDDGVALPSIVVGTRIAEQKTFQVVVTGVALADPAESGAVSLAVTGTSTGGNQGQELLAFDVTANPIPRSVDRYVRNLNEARNPGVIDGAGDDLQIQHEGNWYFKEDVSAKEGDEVEILIVMNAGNLEDQTGIRLEDTLSPFVEYIDGSTLFFANGGEEGASMARLSKYEWILELNGKAEAGARWDLAKNTSAHVTYKVKVLGEVESLLPPIIGATNGEGGMPLSEIVVGQIYYLLTHPSTDHRHPFSLSSKNVSWLTDVGGGVVIVSHSEGSNSIADHTHGIDINPEDGFVTGVSNDFSPQIADELDHIHQIDASGQPPGRWAQSAF